MATTVKCKIISVVKNVKYHTQISHNDIIMSPVYEPRNRKAGCELTRGLRGDLNLPGKFSPLPRAFYTFSPQGSIKPSRSQYLATRLCRYKNA